MSNTAVRFKKNDIPYDAFNEKAKLVNFGVKGVDPKFTSTTNNAGNFSHNSYLGNGQIDLDMNFTGKFTVSFWAKFPTGGLGTSAVADNVFFMILNDGTEIKHTITSTDTNWHHYSIVRDGTNAIVMRVDGVTVETATSNAPLNLQDNSYIGLGNIYRHFTGYDVITDDIVILNGSLWKADFDTNLPADYIDLADYRQFLYIVVSTGEVWGYSD